jgi:hypothetical protein
MDKTATDLLLEKMFRARQVVLRAAAVFVALLVTLCLNKLVFLLTDRGELLLMVAPLWAVLLVIVGGSLVTCYYAFRACLCEAGLAYAIGHAALCMALTTVFLFGIIVVPLQIRYDIERWRRSGNELPEGGELRA